MSLSSTSSRDSKRKGFTLLEVIMYAALFSLMLSAVVAVVYWIVGSAAQTRSRVDVESEANFLMQKIEWGLTGIQAINQPPTNTTSSLLSVNKYNFSQNPLVFDAVSGTARLTRGLNPPAALTDSNVRVGQLLFQHLASSSGMPEGVLITLTVLASSSENLVRPSTTLGTTIYLKQ